MHPAHPLPNRDAPDDFDGDHEYDLTLYRPSTGTWRILESSTGYAQSMNIQWGLSTDVPVPGDYDGDGIADLAVYRPSTGYWYILQSSTDYTNYIATAVGHQHATSPCRATTMATARPTSRCIGPSTGYWYILQSSTNYTTYTRTAVGRQHRHPGAGRLRRRRQDRPRGVSPVDWRLVHPLVEHELHDVSRAAVGHAAPTSRCRATTTATARPTSRCIGPSTGYWYILQSSTATRRYIAQQWGLGTDIPVPGDYDGDGKTDLAVYRPSTGYWYILLSNCNFGCYESYQWGTSTDVPVIARR